MDEAERCAQVFVMNQGRVLAQGSPAALIAPARGLTHVVTPPEGMAARDLQARLIDTPERVIDAVPSGGRVRFIMQPGADPAGLLDDASAQPRAADLEDAFMGLLRQAQPACLAPALPVSTTAPSWMAR